MQNTSSSALPCAGRISCDLCHRGKAVFDETRTASTDGNWRITANPLAWGNPRPEVLVLGFSKGPSQAGELTRLPHNEIPYRKGRLNVGKILAHVGLMEPGSKEHLRQQIDAAIAETDGRFGWGSLVRCTVERFDAKRGSWVGSGGMIDAFMESEFGRRVADNCATGFLRDLPVETRLVVMFGLGTRQKYVQSARDTFARVRPGNWRWINDVAYTDGRITVVHVEHFASQGALLPQWLGEKGHPRQRFGEMARAAVAAVMRA